MGLPAGLTWEVRTTGNANNGGAYIDLIPGTSVDYSQQNAAQLSVSDGACLLASITLTSVNGGFTAAMVGNLIQIRVGGVNFVAGFYEIVLWNSVNSVNLDRTPVAAGNGTGGLGEVGGALISPETCILNAVAGNIAYIKSGNYAFAASRTFTNTGITLFGYDTARNQRPTGNNRPLLQLGAFFITTTLRSYFHNLRFTGSAVQIIYGNANQLLVFNCRFENTNNAGTRSCINFPVNTVPTSPIGSQIIDTEFVGTLGADSRGFFCSAGNSHGLSFMFCFFHDLTYGVCCPGVITGVMFFKCTFARIGTTSIVCDMSYPGLFALFNSFYSAGSYHIDSLGNDADMHYGNTFDSAVISAIKNDSVPDNLFSWINSNDFWNNGASVIGCQLDFGNIGLDPLWVNPGANDFNFGPGSPCIDNALGVRLGV